MTALRRSAAACSSTKLDLGPLRGWALWKALVTMGKEKKAGENAQAAARRFGMADSPRTIIGILIADHARSAGR